MTKSFVAAQSKAFPYQISIPALLIYKLLLWGFNKEKNCKKGRDSWCFLCFKPGWLTILTVPWTSGVQNQAHGLSPIECYLLLFCIILSAQNSLLSGFTFLPMNISVTFKRPFWTLKSFYLTSNPFPFQLGWISMNPDTMLAITPIVIACTRPVPTPADTNSRMEGEVGMKSYPLPEELIVIDEYYKEYQFSLRVWTLAGQPQISEWVHALQSKGSTNWTWWVQRKRTQSWVGRGGQMDLGRDGELRWMWPKYSCGVLNELLRLFLKEYKQNNSQGCWTQATVANPIKKNSMQYYKNTRKLRTTSQRTPSLRLGQKVGDRIWICRFHNRLYNGEISMSDNAGAQGGTEMPDRCKWENWSRIGIPPWAYGLCTRHQHSGAWFCLAGLCCKLLFIGLHPMKSQSTHELIN